MAYASVNVLLDKARGYEQGLEAYYKSTCDRTQNPGVKLLSRYMGRDRRHVNQVLNAVSPVVRAAVNRDRLKYDVALCPAANVHEPESSHSPIRTKDFLENAISHDQELIGFYRRMLECPLSLETKTLVECLIRLEENDIVILNKMIAMNYF